MNTIIKKDGTVEPWDDKKVIEAIRKASERADEPIPTEGIGRVLEALRGALKASEMHVTDIHKAVIHSLNTCGFYGTAKAYQEYRDYKNTYAKAFEKIKDEADAVLLLGDRENANFDSSLVSTKGSLIKGYLTKELYKQFYLSTKEKMLTKRGDIYIHDMRDMIMGSVNCCLFDIGEVLRGGFSMSNVDYTEPTSVLSALQVIGDITLVATAQQFGGFTLAELDKVLLPYCKKTLAKAEGDAITYGIKDIWSYKWKVLQRELEQGFQSLELKLNTVPSSRGDFAFTTITFGQWDKDTPSEDQQILWYIGETILETRQKGHGKDGKPVVFPKLVFLFDKDQHLAHEHSPSEELLKLAIETSAKCMYPDFLSLTGDPEHNVVAQTYLKHHCITSPMGCRAYLTPWADPDTGKYVAIGRCNIGAVSLNLPVIIAVARKEGKDFWEVLDDRMETIREFLKKRYDLIRHTKACTNPMAFMEGGFYKGHLKPDDEIGDLVNYMTASFGLTALNEASILWNGKSLHEDKTFANQVLDFINDRINRYKEEDGYLYALYGTPAESLCGTQAKQYKEYTGDTQFGDYFSNSFHLSVKEHITPFEKQDEEREFFHKCNGGHIQYVRIDNPTNLKAVRDVILRGMSLGFYQGVNFDSVYCNSCGCHSSNSGTVCPHCGARNLTIISRVCGYLGYSYVNGNTRMNDAKMEEIKDRVSM